MNVKDHRFSGKVNLLRDAVLRDFCFAATAGVTNMSRGSSIDAHGHVAMRGAPRAYTAAAAADRVDRPL